MLVSKKILLIDKIVYVERNYVVFRSLCLHIYIYQAKDDQVTLK